MNDSADNGPPQGAAYDSDRSYLGAVYAKGLLGAGQKQGVTEQLLEELDSLLDDVLRHQPKFAAVLASPRIGHDEKVAMLDQAFGGKMHPLMLNFLKVCSRNNRLDCLPAIRHAARSQYNQLHGRIEVLVRSAAPLDDQLRNAIRDKLQQMLSATVDLRESVEPELLGGLIVRIGDTIYDASVATKLKRMRKKALEATVQTFRNALDQFAQTS